MHPFSHPCLLPLFLSSLDSFFYPSIHLFCQNVLPSIHHPCLLSILPSFPPSSHHPSTILIHVSSSCSIKDSFPHLWNGIITTLLCFNNPLKYCTQSVLAPLESSTPAHLGSQTPACSSSMVEKSGSSGLQGPPLLLVGESAVLESKGWTHGLGSEPVGKEGQGVRAEL